MGSSHDHCIGNRRDRSGVCVSLLWMAAKPRIPDFGGNRVRRFPVVRYDCGFIQHDRGKAVGSQTAGAVWACCGWLSAQPRSAQSSVVLLISGVEFFAAGEHLQYLFHASFAGFGFLRGLEAIHNRVNIRPIYCGEKCFGGFVFVEQF